VRYLFAGTELNQAYWVERGKADAGAFNDGDWERTPELVRERLRIIHATPPLLRWLLAYRRGYPREARRAVNGVLLRMHESAEGRAALAQAERIARFEPLAASDLATLDRWRATLADGAW
jgi:phosphonate transport system substrate-binding protein